MVNNRLFFCNNSLGWCGYESGILYPIPHPLHGTCDCGLCKRKIAYSSLRKKPKHYTSGVLARKFQVSDRQIRMDIQLLIDRGCPIQKEKKCYF
ncbi:HTH domain-containing protein, partial [bacterium]|nr:HTH domain-containing protein [bacterium]